jgi:hypothetical protein
MKKNTNETNEGERTTNQFQSIEPVSFKIINTI